MEPQGTFGPRLRQERERRQISLSSIAANTKINQSLLEALERDDLSRWPSGIFRRAFLRSYATAIGMNADDLWKEFSERFPDPSAAEPPEPAHRSSPPDHARATSVAASAQVDRTERLELVFRVSVPRFLAPWVHRLAPRGSTPRRQNT
jgi:cytoskeletal protein RodZ